MASCAPLRILSLDGGGIRGISSLLILEDIMEKIRDASGLDHVPRPCEHFDLIGGTSTGGIIAIMLGRLEMTVDECIQAYRKVAQQAFTPKRTNILPASPTGAFSAKALEAAIKQTVREFCVESECVARRIRGLSTARACPHSEMEFRDRSCTKTVVLAITKDNIDAPPTLFTTYDTSASFHGCAIWQVARATSAATTFFKSITVGRDGIEFIDAGFGYNNPCEVLIEEGRRQFPGHGQIRVLSIGTGLGDVVTIHNKRLSIINGLKEMATTSKKVSARLDGQYGDSGQYYRFNVDRGLQDITLSDWEKASNISSHTRNYLSENQRTIKKFVNDFTSIAQAEERYDGSSKSRTTVATSTINAYFWYRFTLVHQLGFSLDVINDGHAHEDGKLQIAQTGDYSGQHWQLTPSLDGRYRLSTWYTGPKMYLNVRSENNLDPHLTSEGPEIGRYWHVVPNGDGTVKLQLKIAEKEYFLGSNYRPILSEQEDPSQIWKMESIAPIGPASRLAALATDPSRSSRDSYTVGWVCALPDELTAAQEMLDEEHQDLPQIGDDENIYTLGRIGEHDVVLACLPAGLIGPASAAAVAIQMKAAFPAIRFGLMVGIGGGVPSAEVDIRLGDIVVSQPEKGHGGVVQYDFGKSTPSGFKQTGFLNTPPRILLGAVTKLRSNHDRGRSKLLVYISKLGKLPKFARERAGSDVLFEAGYNHSGGEDCTSCDVIRKVQRQPRTDGTPIVHYGTIASGNQVIRDCVTRDKVSSALGGVLCFEMEAAGLMSSFPCLVIRGICDYADSHKNKRWQAYAAGTAAAYAKELLLVIPAADVTKTQTADEATSG